MLFTQIAFIKDFQSACFGFFIKDGLEFLVSSLAGENETMQTDEKHGKQ